jgi:hypothetical protein
VSAARHARWSLAVLAIVVVLAPSCAELSPIAAGECGNLIIEAGEDCDGDDAVGVCRAPGQPGSCRYDCDPADDICPDGFVCGRNGVCLSADVCGNGVPEGAEHCDGPDELGVCRPAGPAGECRYDCTSAECPRGFKCLGTGICDDTDVCGNGRTEPLNGEYCDPADLRPDGICIPAGESGACQFSCKDSPDDCPEGFNCSLNKICRKPSGTFTESEQHVGETIGLALGDLDGDGKRDVVQVTLNGFNVHYFGAQARREATTSLAASATPPVIGDLNGDGRDDLAFRAPSKFLTNAGELAAFAAQGSPERTLAPLTQATEQLPGYAVSLDILQPALNADLLFIDGDIAQGYSYEVDIVDNTVSFGLTAELNSAMVPPLAGEILGSVVADFNRNASPCQDVALAWRGADEVRVFSPCIGLQDSPNWNTNIAPTSVFLPNGQTVWAPPGSKGANEGGAVFTAFVNPDSLPDLVIPTKHTSAPQCITLPPATCGGTANPNDCECLGCGAGTVCGSDIDCVCPACANHLSCNVLECDFNGSCDPLGEGCNCPDCASHRKCTGPGSLQVAYGLGDGSFTSTSLVSLPADNGTSTLPIVANPNFQCPKQLGPLGDSILGVADFNGDGLIDLVSGYGVYVSDGLGQLDYSYCPPENWTEALVADFDGNGTLDVIGSSGGTTLDFVTGGGNGTFSAKQISAGGFARGLVAADFDGDTLTDVGFLRTVSRLIPDQTGVVFDIAVSFGRPSDAPTAPVVAGRTLDAERLVAGRMLLGDGAADLFVQRGLDNAVLLAGDVTRQFVSTLVFRTDKPDPYATHEEVTSMQSLAYGKFQADGRDQGHDFVLAAMTAESTTSGSNARIEMVSSKDNGAELVQWRNSTFSCTDGVCDDWRMVAVDFDNGGVDNLVAFRNNDIRVFAKNQTPLQIAQVDDVALTLFDSGERGPVYSSMVGSPTTADVDANGFEDVAIMSNDGGVYIFWNDGNGQLSKTNLTVVESGTGMNDPDHVRAFAFLQASGDSKLELVTVTDVNARLQLYSSEDRNFGSPSLLSGVPSGDVVVAGDVDGDGVDDLIVGDAFKFTVLRGLAAAP